MFKPHAQCEERKRSAVTKTIALTLRPALLACDYAEIFERGGVAFHVSVGG
jgi:hypothetical protein